MVMAPSTRKGDMAPTSRTFLLLLVLFTGILGFHVGCNWHFTAALLRLHETEKMPFHNEKEGHQVLEAPRTSSPVFKHSLQKSPLISVVLLTGGRIALATQTLSRMVHYFAVREPTVAYDLMWVDNGVAHETFNESLEMEQQFSFEQVLRYRYNSGIGRGVNNAVFISRAPYIMYLEEDWFVRDECFQEDSKTCPRFVSLSMELLTNDTRALRSELRTTDRKESEHLLRCPPPEEFWGGWTNGPSIILKERFLKAVNGFDETITDPAQQEADLSRRAKKAGMCRFTVGYHNIFIHQGQVRSPLNKERAPKARKSYEVGEIPVYQVVGQP
jgi:hypothetical protein